MNKIKLSIILCAITLAPPVNAGIISSTTTNGNLINVYANSIDYTTYIGRSIFEVTFNNLSPVQINFDVGVMVQDDISMYIYNSTGTGWSGFDFSLTGVGINGPFNVELNTSTLAGWQFHENDPDTNKASGVTLMFSGLENVGLYNVSGSADTSFVQNYSLILTPATVPVPAAVWLFATGLIGLIGVARRKV